MAGEEFVERDAERDRAAEAAPKDDDGWDF
jgi:hypothetical protein